MDHAISQTSATIVPRPMISTIRHLNCFRQRDSSRPVAGTYAAVRWPPEVCVPASLASSVLLSSASGDSSGLEYETSRQANRVATIATSPTTMPQYTPDIGHTLACESRKSSFSAQLQAAGRYVHLAASLLISVRVLVSLR